VPTASWELWRWPGWLLSSCLPHCSQPDEPETSPDNCIYNTHTHTCPFHGLFSTTTWVSRCQKGKTNLDLNEAGDDGVWDGSGISWTICKQSAPCSRQITTPTSHHSIFTGRMLLQTPNQTVSKQWRTNCKYSIYTQIQAHSQTQLQWQESTKTNISWFTYYFTSAAVAVDSSHITASSSALWSRFSPTSNFINGHMSTTWFMVCRWPQSQDELKI